MTKSYPEVSWIVFSYFLTLVCNFPDFFRPLSKTLVRDPCPKLARRVNPHSLVTFSSPILGFLDPCPRSCPRPLSETLVPNWPVAWIPTAWWLLVGQIWGPKIDKRLGSIFFICVSYVIHMWFRCDSDVIQMWFKCDSYVFHMCFKCDLYVIHIWLLRIWKSLFLFRPFSKKTF